MKILVTGADGYLGWPFIASLSLKYPKATILGIDNAYRRRWVKNLKSDTAIKIASFSDRKKFLKKINKNNDYLNFDLTNFKKVDYIIKKNKFDLIFNLAAQPSAPFSIISAEHCNFTQNNNNQILRNFIWALKKNNKEKTCFVHTTTTGTYGTPNFPIPEGFLKVKNKKYLFGHMAGSWYHNSKCHDTTNLHFANRIWNMNIHDFRTAIILGLNYDRYEFRKDNLLNTRFDYDFYFGVVAHRFIAMSYLDKDLTVYGKGLQKKPFISLNDTIKSLINFVKHKNIKKNGYNVYNQYTFLSSINSIAENLSKLNPSIKIKHIKNPRIEDEKHQMKMINQNFRKVLKEKFETPNLIFRDTINILKMNNASFKKNFK